ncbi:MAG: MlrC C-terminal domain-containing protein [Candidatus Bathyarchaeota archaeon]|nr:MlrC C-terminal domain-containing protein [Candidatus Bathyarchaeota archaeon]
MIDALEQTGTSGLGIVILIEYIENKILVLKSRGHLRAAYEPFSKQILEVDAPGLITPNLSWFTYKNNPRPMSPYEKNAVLTKV